MCFYADRAFDTTTFFSLEEVLLPPAPSCSSTPILINCSMSRRVVREEAFVSFIHL